MKEISEPTYNELRKLETAILNHGGVFKRKFELLMEEQAARSHDNYRRVLLHCWVDLHWRPSLMGTQVRVVATIS